MTTTISTAAAKNRYRQLFTRSGRRRRGGKHDLGRIKPVGYLTKKKVRRKIAKISRRKNRGAA